LAELGASLLAGSGYRRRRSSSHCSRSFSGPESAPAGRSTITVNSCVNVLGGWSVLGFRLAAEKCLQPGQVIRIDHIDARGLQFPPGVDGIGRSPKANLPSAGVCFLYEVVQLLPLF